MICKALPQLLLKTASLASPLLKSCSQLYLPTHTHTLPTATGRKCINISTVNSSEQKEYKFICFLSQDSFLHFLRQTLYFHNTQQRSQTIGSDDFSHLKAKTLFYFCFPHRIHLNVSCTVAGMNELKGVHGSLCTHGQSSLSLYTKYICKNINFKCSFLKKLLVFVVLFERYSQ